MLMLGLAFTIRGSVTVACLSRVSREVKEKVHDGYVKDMIDECLKVFLSPKSGIIIRSFFEALPKCFSVMFDSD